MSRAAHNSSTSRSRFLDAESLRYLRGYIDSMNLGGKRKRRLAVGCRVRIKDESHATGEIVEDFGASAGAEVVIDSSRTARGRRWAVALDDGTIGFFADDAIDPI